MNFNKYLLRKGIAFFFKHLNEILLNKLNIFSKKIKKLNI